MRAEVFEVGPRDGLQSEKKIFTLKERFNLISFLIQSGLPRIEVGSFVRSDWIPQLQGTGVLVRKLREKFLSQKTLTPKPEMWAFVPNLIGFEMALESNIDGTSFFIATSETFCRKNIRRSIAEALSDLKILLAQAKKNKVSSRVYLSTLVFCPYEGKIAPSKVQKQVYQLLEMGAQEVVLSDTTGHAHPRSIEQVLEKVLKIAPASRLAFHLHDTRGLALANVLVGLQHGIKIFDSSVGGLGGCPYAPGSSGNLATEDLVNMLSAMGLMKETNLGRLIQAGQFAEKVLGRKLPSKVLRTLSL